MVVEDRYDASCVVNLDYVRWIQMQFDEFYLNCYGRLVERKLRVQFLDVKMEEIETYVEVKQHANF